MVIRKSIKRTLKSHDRRLKDLYRKIDSINEKNFNKKQTETFIAVTKKDGVWDRKTKKFIISGTGETKWEQGRDIAQGWLGILNKFDNQKNYLTRKGSEKDIEKLKLVEQLVKSMPGKSLMNLKRLASLTEPQINDLTTKQYNAYLKSKTAVKSLIITHKAMVKEGMKGKRNRSEAFSYLIKNIVKLLEQSL